MKTGKLLLFLSVVATVTVPFIPLLLWSISEKWFYPAPLPHDFGLRAFHYIFETASSQIMSGLATSGLLATVTAIVSLLLGIPAGRALGLYTFKGKMLVTLLLTLPIIVPPLSVAMGLHLWFIKLNLTETFWGVVLIHLTFCLPYTVFVIWGVFSDYDPEIEEQALSLGCTRLSLMTKVMVPIILPGITVSALFTFLLSWSQYLSTLIIGGGKMLTLPILLFSLMDSGDRPVAAAVSLLFIVPVFVALMASAHNLGRAGITGIR